MDVGLIPGSSVYCLCFPVFFCYSIFTTVYNVLCFVLPSVIERIATTLSRCCTLSFVTSRLTKALCHLYVVTVRVGTSVNSRNSSSSVVFQKIPPGGLGYSLITIRCFSKLPFNCSLFTSIKQVLSHSLRWASLPLTIQSKSKGG